MSQVEKADLFQALHVSHQPLILYNIWDAGGAKALAKAGAKAIATGSWSIAAAHGFTDGEMIPLDFALTIIRQITQATDLPVTVDFEGAYAKEPEQVALNVARVIDAGAVGINFEDQVVGGSGLYSIADQASRIGAARRAANEAKLPLFINARTDLFLKAGSSQSHAGLIEEALLRQKAYSEAGANGFFVPGLKDRDLIDEICKRSSLPVNALVAAHLSYDNKLMELGVARISFGPKPYVDALEDLTKRFTTL